MEFSIEIGEGEKHKLQVQRNWFTGRMAILLDSVQIVAKSPYNLPTHFSLKLAHDYEFSVGENEIHKVRVERLRPRLFAGFRPQTYRVLIDGLLVKEVRGY